MPRAVKFDEIWRNRCPACRRGRPTGSGTGASHRPDEGCGYQPRRGRDPGGRLRQAVARDIPSGQGSDLAGVVEAVGSAVRNVAVGDEVIGFSNNRSSHAELVIVEADHLVGRPAHVSWEQAGALFVAGTTAYAAVQAVSLKAGDTVVISGAAGGVGSIAVQLAKILGAKVIGLASAANHTWLADHGVIPVAYGEGVADRIRAASGGKIDAFIDTFGGGYVDLALELGVAPDRIDTIIDFAAAAKHGVKTAGNSRGGECQGACGTCWPDRCRPPRDPDRQGRRIRRHPAWAPGTARRVAGGHAWSGIVVAARDNQDQFYVVADLSGRYAPHEWAEIAVGAYKRVTASLRKSMRGGAMVEATIRNIDPRVPIRTVHASRGKVTRAEPISALYEQGESVTLGRSRPSKIKCVHSLPTSIGHLGLQP